jgi:predicted DNA binding CopG/RHH family protein
MRDRMRTLQRQVQEFVQHVHEEIVREAFQQHDGRDMPIPVRMTSTKLAKIKIKEVVP